jgi:hypothetical protein
MKSSKLFLTIALLSAGAARAAQIDMDDPRRAVGREDDIRIDATLLDDTVSAGSVIGVTWQIQNLTNHPIAVAEKVCSSSFDADSSTITVAIGSEVPVNGMMPKMVTINAGDKKTFTIGAMFNTVTSNVRSPFVAVPRYVQVKVNVLRDLVPFHALLQQQAQSPHPVALTDDQFDHWMESNDSIFLNTVPVRFDATRSRRSGAADAERHSMFGTP